MLKLSVAAVLAARLNLVGAPDGRSVVTSDPTSSVVCITMTAKETRAKGLHLFACTGVDTLSRLVMVNGGLLKKSGAQVCQFYGFLDPDTRCLLLTGCGGDRRLC